MYRKTVHIPLEAARWPIQREWAQLDDLCDGVFDCPHSTPSITSTGPFVVRSQDVRTGVFRTDEAARVSEETYQERIARAEPAYGDILYSREGTYFGNAAEVPENTRVCLGQRMVLIRPTRGTLNSRFLRLWLNSPVLSRHIHGFRDGTVAERLNMPTIRALPVPIFDIKEQETIASILGVFDDKIELNRRINETLEAMVRSIFKDWFVDFGPIRAKAEGRPPYLARDIWSPFPGRLDDEDRPEGWTVKSLADVTKYMNRGISPSYLEIGGVLVLNQKCVRDGHVDRSKGRRHDPAKRSVDGRQVEVGDVLINSTGVGTLGRVAQVLALDEETIVDSHVTVVRADGDCLSWNFLGIDLLRREDEIEALGEGSTGQTELPRLRLANLPIIFPQREVVNSFDKVVLPLRKRVTANHSESRILASTRDLLLPKLMSGEVRVRDAEKIVRKVS